MFLLLIHDNVLQKSLISNYNMVKILEFDMKKMTLLKCIQAY